MSDSDASSASGSDNELSEVESEPETSKRQLDSDDASEEEDERPTKKKRRRKVFCIFGNMVVRILGNLCP